MGGGSLPLARLAGFAVALRRGPEIIAALRRGTPPVIALVRDGNVVLDVRCISDVGELAGAVASACERAAEAPAGKGATLGVDPPGADAPDESEM